MGRRKPSGWAVHPGIFGIVGAIEWHPARPNSPEVGQLEAAKQQHRISRQVRVNMSGRRKNQRTLAREVGVSPQQIGRILQGEAHLLLWHLVALESYFPGLSRRDSK